jgi:hypothetical protein
VSEHKSLTDQIGNKCRHFNGLLHDTCKVGVAYSSVRDSSSTGPYRFPCLKDNNCSERCTSVSYLTPEEIAEEESEIRQAVTAFFDDMNAGLCPECHQKVERQVQVGRCVYSEPCGHRLWQGKARNEVKQ